LAGFDPHQHALFEAEDLVNMPFRALKLGYPNVVECEVASRVYPETFPLTSRLRFEFPERESDPSEDKSARPSGSGNATLG